MSNQQTPRLALPFLVAGQAQKHVTLNEALARLDACVATSVLSRTLGLQPDAPAEGDGYLLPDGAEGEAWTLHEPGALVVFDGGIWRPLGPPDGLLVHVRDEGRVLMRHEGAWVELAELIGGTLAVDGLALGTDADPANPFTARLNSALLTAREADEGGTGDVRLVLNKAPSGGVASLLLQSGFAGRAEVGLSGDDDLRLKVSDDGETWREVLVVDRTTGRAAFAVSPQRCETTVMAESGVYEVPGWARRLRLCAVGGGGGGGSGAAGGAATNRFGGGGGGGGQVFEESFEVLELPGPLTVTVGAGGTGGAGVPGTSSGIGGQSGGATIVSVGGQNVLVAVGGSGGLGGGTASGAGGGAVAPSGGGGNSSVTGAAATGGTGQRAPGGGGGGGGLDSDSARAGGPGGRGYSGSGHSARRSNGGGGGAPDAAGDGGQSQAWARGYGAGGGGGGASLGDEGGAGGPGASGGGGGGGGAARESATSGSGGDGGDGFVWIMAIG